jgi:hypothetical protein
MSLFGNLKSDGLEESQDRLGGNFGAVDTDIYSGTIKALYAGKSTSSEARSVSIILETNGREYREVFWVTNGKGENFFLNKDDKTKKVPLPGFTIVDDICLVATGKPLAEQEAEDKVIKLYDSEVKKELPKSVPMITEAIGKPISLGVLKQIVNKNVKNEQTGKYEPTAESREENVTDKVFDTESKLTVVEARAGSTEAAFWGGWLERNKGKTRDRRSIKEGEAGAAGAPPKSRAAGSATPPAANQTAAPRKSLFGKAA